MESNTHAGSSPRRPVVGRLLIAIGVLHTILGIAANWSLLGDVFSEGFVGQWNGSDARAAALWFLVTGLMLLPFGAAVSALERARPRLPISLGAGLLAVAALGIAAVPASGFWFVAATGALALRRAVHGPRSARSRQPVDVPS